MNLESVVVTGANRGIGLEFVRQLVHLPNPPQYVFATYRSETTTQELKGIQDAAEMSEVVLIKMDVTKVDEIREARKVIEGKLGENGLSLLVNNAGGAKPLLFPNQTDVNLHYHYSTNSVGPVLVLQELLPLLQKAADRGSSSSSGMCVSRAAVLNISSALGSLTYTASENRYKMPQAIGYKMSKAALNMAMRVIADQLKEKGILVVMMCPGWVKTDLGTQAAELEVTDSVSDIIKTLAQLNEDYHGAYIDRHGKAIPL